LGEKEKFFSEGLTMNSRKAAQALAVFLGLGTFVTSARAEFFLITDVGSDKIRVFNSADNSVKTLLNGTSAFTPFTTPYGITSSGGNLFFSSLGPGKVYEYTTAGTFSTLANLSTLSPHDSYPGYLSTASVTNGSTFSYIIANDFQNSRIAFIPTNGGNGGNPISLPFPTGTTILTTPTNPTGIAVKSDGEIWVMSSASSQNAIYHYQVAVTPTGTPSLTLLNLITQASNVRDSDGHVFPNGGSNITNGATMLYDAVNGAAGTLFYFSNFGTTTVGRWNGFNTNNVTQSNSSAIAINGPAGLAFDSSLYNASNSSTAVLDVLSTTNHAIYQISGSASPGSGTPPSNWVFANGGNPLSTNFTLPVGIIDYGSTLPAAWTLSATSDPAPAGLGAPEPGSVVLVAIGGLLLVGAASRSRRTRAA
jgi:hypothetical protein